MSEPRDTSRSSGADAPKPNLFFRLRNDADALYLFHRWRGYGDELPADWRINWVWAIGRLLSAIARSAPLLAEILLVIVAVAANLLMLGYFACRLEMRWCRLTSAAQVPQAIRPPPIERIPTRPQPTWPIFEAQPPAPDSHANRSPEQRGQTLQVGQQDSGARQDQTVDRLPLAASSPLAPPPVRLPPLNAPAAIGPAPAATDHV